LLGYGLARPRGGDRKIEKRYLDIDIAVCPVRFLAFFVAILLSSVIVILSSWYESIAWDGEISLQMKFLLVDDHTLIREALRGVLNQLDGGATILEASRWSDAARLLEEHPDLALVLLDLGLPDRKGFAALEEARARHPKIPIVILSGTCDRDHVEKALNLGAVGFIPKSGEREVMLSALRLVFSGGVYIPPEILSRPETSNGLAHSTAAGGRRPDGSPPAVPADLGLTARQIDVLALMMRGKSNKAICRILNLAEPTVKNHVTAILKALKASNRTEAVVLVGELGWELPQLEG
jgi:DNA-binding NarL/FixJ family response regulator